jgi:hypothetical protein
MIKKPFRLKRCLMYVVCVFGTAYFMSDCYSSITIAQGVTKGGKARSFATTTASLTEEFSFAIKDFKMDHQGEMQNLNLRILIRYVAGTDEKRYPDFRLIAKDIEELLAKYPNKNDYWEVVNKRLTDLVIKKYSSVNRIVSEIEVTPSSLVPYLRSSIVTRVRSGKSRRIQ